MNSHTVSYYQFSIIPKCIFLDLSRSTGILHLKSMLVDSNMQYMVLGAIGQILRNQGLKLWNIQAHIINFQAPQSVFFWVCLDQLVYYILKAYCWTLTCSIWWLGLLDSFGEIAFLGFRIYELTYWLILSIFKHTKVDFFGSVQTNWYTTSQKYAGGL